MSEGDGQDLGGSVGDLPGFEIESELGRGGFSRVFLARQPRLHRTVAVKVLTHIDARDTEAHRRFEAECQAVGSLSWHPHVVTVYDTGTTSAGHPFLAMEHLPGGSLQAKLDDHGAAPWQEVVRVGAELAEALAAAHQAGILHRDVKPANVLADRLGEHRLADFGIARFGDATRTATGVITGTAAYTAPEVLRGDRASPASDLYSLGATLHALLVGRAPFLSGGDESVMAVMYRVATVPPAPLEATGAPPSLTGLVLSLMAKDPAARPGSAVDVGQWLQQIQRDHGLPLTTLRAASSQPPPPAPPATAAPAVPPVGPTTPEPATLPPPPPRAPAAPAPPPRPRRPPPQHRCRPRRCHPRRPARLPRGRVGRRWWRWRQPSWCSWWPGASWRSWWPATTTVEATGSTPTRPRRARPRRRLPRAPTTRRPPWW